MNIAENEQVVGVDVKLNKNDMDTVHRYVIKDISPELAGLAHYRTDHGLTDYNAWTRFLSGAWMFIERSKAQAALEQMWAEREDIAAELKENHANERKRHPENS